MDFKLNDYIVIDKVAYESMPNAINVDTDSFAVPVDSRYTLSGDTVRIVRVPDQESLIESSSRLSNYNIFEIRWENKALVDVCFIDHLNTLYQSFKPFFFFFDTKFSKENIELLRANETEYIFSNFPIFYTAEKVGTTEVRDYALKIYKNNVLIDNGYFINNETGSVIFNEPLMNGDIITASYKWCAYVKINNFTYQNITGIAKNVYSCSLILEQIDFPDEITEKDILYRLNDCRECTISNPLDKNTSVKDDGTTREVVCTGPYIFNDTCQSISDNINEIEWINLDNHKLDDSNLVSVLDPIDYGGISQTLKFTGPLFTNLPLNKNIKSISCELDIVTSDSANILPVVDIVGTINVPYKYTDKLAKFKEIRGSQKVTYTSEVESVITTNELINSGLEFDYKITDVFSVNRECDEGYQPENWTLNYTFNGNNVIITATYIGNVAYMPDNILINVLTNASVQPFNEDNDEPVPYYRCDYVINNGIDNEIIGSLTEEPNPILYFPAQKIYNLKVENGVGRLTLLMASEAKTYYNEELTDFTYGYTSASIELGIVTENCDNFDSKKLKSVNPDTFEIQWNNLYRYDCVSEVIYRTSTGNVDYYTVTDTITPSTGFDLDSDGYFSAKIKGKLTHTFEWVGSSTAPPFVIVEITSNTSASVNWELAGAYAYNGLDSTTTEIKVANVLQGYSQSGSVIKKLPVINNIAKLILDVEGFCSRTSPNAQSTPNGEVDMSSSSNIYEYQPRAFGIDINKITICYYEDVDTYLPGETYPVVKNIVYPTLSSPTVSATNASVSRTFLANSTYMFNLLGKTTNKNDRIVGLEVNKLTTKFISPVNSNVNTAFVSARIGYGNPSAFSPGPSQPGIAKTKSNQNVDEVNHENIGLIDGSTTTKTFGGLYDYFGLTQLPTIERLFLGTFNGLGGEVIYNQTSSVLDVHRSIDYTYGYSVTGTGSIFTGSTLLVGNNNGYGSQPGGTLNWTGSSSTGSGKLETTTIISVTNTNNNTPVPKYVNMFLTSNCSYNTNGAANNTTVFTGFDYKYENATTDTLVSFGQAVKVPFGEDKVGKYIINQGVYTDVINATNISLKTGVTATITTNQETPSIEDFNFIIYTARPSSTDVLYFKNSNAPISAYNGTNWTELRTSDGTTTNAYTIDLSNLNDFPLLDASTVITGIQLYLKYKKPGNQNLAVNFNAVYSNSNTVKNLRSLSLVGAINEYQKIIGGGVVLNNFTCTVQDILDNFKLQITGTNQLNTIFSALNIGVRFHYVKIQ
jgi:hypothetical protein